MSNFDIYIIDLGFMLLHTTNDNEMIEKMN
jgi:hypothetical protein